MLKNRKEALSLLSELGATPRLLHHAETVAEAADLVYAELRSLNIVCDARLIQVGAVLHDVGKIPHPDELSRPGKLHENAGQALLLANGIPPEVARFCLSHAMWNLAGATLEERVVALADKLRKGKRDADLELFVIDEVADRLGSSRWQVFDLLDSSFERIAGSGAERLEQSRLY